MSTDDMGVRSTGNTKFISWVQTKWKFMFGLWSRSMWGLRPRMRSRIRCPIDLDWSRGLAMVNNRDFCFSSKLVYHKQNTKVAPDVLIVRLHSLFDFVLFCFVCLFFVWEGGVHSDPHPLMARGCQLNWFLLGVWYLAWPLGCVVGAPTNSCNPA